MAVCQPLTRSLPVTGPRTGSRLDYDTLAQAAKGSRNARQDLWRARRDLLRTSVARWPTSKHATLGTPRGGGGRGGIRTHTALSGPPDFKSGASSFPPLARLAAGIILWRSGGARKRKRGGPRQSRPVSDEVDRAASAAYLAVQARFARRHRRVATPTLMSAAANGEVDG